MMPRRRIVRDLYFALALMFAASALAACTRDGGSALQPVESRQQTAFGSEGAGATATPFILPTLLPTITRSAPAAATATRTPPPEPSPQGTVDFDQPVVELRYGIPALQLDRRLEGNVNGQITVVDETRGLAAIRQNQGGVLLELQSILPSLELEPLPEGCDTCVAFSYAMPLENAESEGWLQDPVLLASVENFTAALLGPHFPPATTVGLRRSATAYDVAHTLALTDEGLLYRWLATDGNVEAPIAVGSAAPELPALVDSLDGDELAAQYVVNCVSTPLETLYLNSAPTPEAAAPAPGEAEGDDGQTIRVACPAFSLPQSLQPLYLQLDALLQETLAGHGLPRPPTEVALEAVLDYRREDGARLALSLDGATRITNGAGETVTTTLSSTQVMSITTALLDGGALQPGLTAFTAGELENVLLVRGSQGMMEVAWPAGEAPEAILEEVRVLDELMEIGEGPNSVRSETGD